METNAKKEGASSLPFVLRTEAGKELKGEVRLDSDKNLQVYFEGYGENGATEGHGTPIVIEFYDKDYNGKPAPWVHCFADINSEEPTASISLAGAAEKLRKPE
jgi:hypothetical protein